MNQKRFEDVLDFIARLVADNNLETKKIVIKEKCYLIDEELLPIINFAIDQFVKKGYVKQVEWLREFGNSIDTWKKKILKSIELYSQYNYLEGIRYAEEALILAERIWLNDHSNLAESINNLGLFLEVLQRGKEAEQCYLNALAMRQRLFPTDHPDVAFDLYYLGVFLLSQGKLAEAESFSRDALAMRQRLFPTNHPDIALSLSNLGKILQLQNKLAEAESFSKDALVMRQRLPQADRFKVDQSFDDFSLLFEKKGRLTEAEFYYRDVLGFSQKLFPESFDVVAIRLNQLGMLLKIEGKFTEAEFYYRDALAMGKKLCENGHSDIVASTLSNLGLLLKEQGRLTEAESCLLKALAIGKKLCENSQSDIDIVATASNNLGLLLIEREKFIEAESYLLEALEANQKLYEECHPNIATTYNNLGLLFHKRGRLIEAKSYFVEALAMRQKLYKENHLDVVQSLMNLGFLLLDDLSYEEALISFQKVIVVENKIASQVFSFSSELDRLRYLNRIRITTEFLLSLIVTYFLDNLQVIQKILDTTLQRKSLSASAFAAFNSVIYEERYQYLREKLQQWHSLEKQIFHLTFNQDNPKDREHLVQLIQETNRLEKYLSSQVLEIQLKDRKIDHETVAKKLPSGSILLEFVRFYLFNFENRQWNSPFYAVFVLPAGQADKVEMKILGEATEIETLIEYTRLLAIAYVHNADGELQVTRFDGKKLGIDVEKFSQTLPQIKLESIPNYHYIPRAAIQLRQKILNPVWDFVKDSQQIFISPDGDLNLLPFGILPLDDTGKELLSDRYKISYLSSARDLFRSTVSTNRPASAPLVIADPKFLLDESDSVAISQNETIENQSTPTTLDSQLIEVLDEESLSRAETTGLLAEKVAEMLGVEPHLQADALVSHLKNNQCPRILLIGTHGLYYPLSEAQQNAIAHRNRDRLSSLPQAANPMIRSGLAFAGAANWQKNLPLPPEAGNGYLMAQDVAQLDLWANEITVLLACNSAVGDVHQGEGVFGLRRAFAVAGAKTLIMSLWSVPEKASALLMERFFDNLKQKMGRGAALQEAQNYIRFITVEELRQSDLGLEVLKELTANRNFNSETLVEDESCQPLKHPFYWGAWICQGETTPCDIQFE